MYVMKPAPPRIQYFTKNANFECFEVIFTYRVKHKKFAPAACFSLKLLILRNF